ncbi:Exodeoxyribonuclease VII small subunit [hydrothermal vent metagenome]|uniref:Exodeoxyribonuclease VII small subunit n=1 Tax=hydrothermal vent metagenome TaxID=652676 RepID=A0A3B0WPU8_9ZZZZ
MARKSLLNFEKAMSQLEELVEDMEQGDLPLEEALKHFEKGIALAANCQQALTKAEQKVTQLIEKNARLLEEPFQIDE